MYGQFEFNTPEIVYKKLHFCKYGQLKIVIATIQKLCGQFIKTLKIYGDHSTGYKQEYEILLEAVNHLRQDGQFVVQFIQRHHKLFYFKRFVEGESSRQVLYSFDL